MRIVRPASVLLFALIATTLPAWLLGQAKSQFTQIEGPKAAVFDATHLNSPRDLDGIWLMHVGDDPSFADTDFDDSNWTDVDLRMPLTTVLHGAHPEVVWYRQRVNVDPSQTAIALREETLARAFEIYVNGERLESTGGFAPIRSYTYDAPMLARIPDRMRATGRLLIAVRVGITGQDWNIGFPGLAAGNLTLGNQNALADKDWLEIIGNNLSSFLDWILTIALGFVALALFISQRRQREYLWIFLLGMVQLAELPVRTITLLLNIPIGWRFLNASFSIATPFLLVAMYFDFVNRKVGRKFFVFLLIAGLLNAYSMLGGQQLVPTLPGSYGLLTNLPFVILLALVVVIVLALDWRRGNREAGILLIPAISFSLYIYANYTLALLSYFPRWTESAQRGLGLIQRYPVGPFAISMNDICGILSTIALALIMVLRSSRTSRRQAVLENELAAAREVQQIMLPDAIDSIAGFSVESAYEPAQQVGGDFFQVIPTRDGGLLLVFGDVAGKGLSAAMLVSVLVGAIRTVAEYTSSPAETLASLNERLIGRSRGGFSTALAAKFSPDGSVDIANAGHLSPYLNGRETALLSALPLGILSNEQYQSIHIELNLGDRLTFYSDGVIEAQDSKGQLLGFDRGQELSTEPAASIVEAAKQFGQSDDITVVAIVYEGWTEDQFQTHSSREKSLEECV